MTERARRMAEKRAERAASRARIEAAQAETRRVVESGHCPDCGSALRRNLALAGWWTCEQRGDGHFRARPADPACSWQGFTHS